jgi:hypothetical protein
MSSLLFSELTAVISLSIINQLIFVMNGGVIFLKLELIFKYYIRALPLKAWVEGRSFFQKAAQQLLKYFHKQGIFIGC